MIFYNLTLVSLGKVNGTGQPARLTASKAVAPGNENQTAADMVAILDATSRHERSQLMSEMRAIRDQSAFTYQVFIDYTRDEWWLYVNDEFGEIDTDLSRQLQW